MQHSQSPFKKNLSLGKKVDPHEIRLDSRPNSKAPSFRDNLNIPEDQNSAYRLDSEILINRNKKATSIIDPSYLLDHKNGQERSDFDLLKRNIIANKLIGDQNENTPSSTSPYNSELYFNILTLKKMIYELVQQNEHLKHTIKVQQDNEPKYCNRIKSLSYKVEELNLKERLDLERPSDISHDDLDEIDKDLLIINESLESAMGSKGQENFIQQVIESNKEFFHIADKYSESLQSLEDATQQFKMLLVNVNTVNFT